MMNGGGRCFCFLGSLSRGMVNIFRLSRWLVEGVGGVGRYMIYRIFPRVVGLTC